MTNKEISERILMDQISSEEKRVLCDYNSVELKIKHDSEYPVLVVNNEEISHIQGRSITSKDIEKIKDLGIKIK